MSEDKPILGPTGQPARPVPKSAPLGEAAEALVKIELNSARDALREQNRTQFEDIRKEIAGKWRLLTLGLASLSGILGISLFNAYFGIPAYVRTQLLEPKVDATVDRIIAEKSADYVDNKLKPLDDKIEATGARLDRKMVEVSGLIIEARKTISETRAITDFQDLIARAMSDNRRAFLDLAKISASDSPYSQYASNVLLTLSSDEMNSPYTNTLEVRWDVININRESATLEEFDKGFPKTAPNTYMAYCKAIWKAKQFSRKEKLAYFLKLIETTSSIAKLAAACGALREDSKLDKEFLDEKY